MNKFGGTTTDFNNSVTDYMEEGAFNIYRQKRWKKKRTCVVKERNN